MYQQAAYSPHRSTYWPRRPRFVQQPPASVSKRHGADRRCRRRRRRRIPIRSTGAKNERATVFSTTPPSDGSPPRCRSVSETPLHPPAAPPLASYLTPTHPPTLPPLPRNMAERHAHSPTYRVTKSFPGVGWRGLRDHFSASQDGFVFFLSTVSSVFLLLLPPR